LPRVAGNVASKSEEKVSNREKDKKSEAALGNEVKPAKEDSSKTLQKLEILKEVIQENKQEQKKLLKEQQQILEGLKQHRREAEKLREKSELERKRAALNASAEYKLKTSFLKDAAADKTDLLKVPEKNELLSPQGDQKSRELVVPAETPLKAAVAPEIPVKQVPLETPKKEAVPLKLPEKQVVPETPKKQVVPIEKDAVSPEKQVVPPETQRKQEVPDAFPKERPRPAVRAEVKEPEVLREPEEPKEPVKSGGSQQEAPVVEDKAPSKALVEPARLQPPLPLPPQSNKKPPLAGQSKENRNSGKYENT